MDADEYTALGGRLDLRQVCGWYERMESIEIDEDFLCFTDLYAPASRLVPSDWTVVDLGGYVGVQAGLFKGRYVDVDCYDLMGDDLYLPPRRYRASNASHVVSDIMAWLGANPRLPRRTLLLMSGVPGYAPILHELYRRGGDWAFWYPGTRAVGHGKLGGRISAAVARDA